ncbi:MAG TPA: hypothetical protein GX745_06025 [Clostridiales bacterium]|jgi:uncharacterized membrane protein|nr:hypothetical protein [Clostridiales bacterium]
MKQRSLSANIALYAIFTALLAAFLFLPYVFLIPLIIMVIFMDFKASVYISIACGLISITYAFMMASFVALAFRQYPLIAIIPRLFIGPAAYGTKIALRKLTKNSKNFFMREVLPYSIIGAVATLTNTILVVGSFAIFARGFSALGVAMPLAIGEMLIAGCIELAIAIVITPAIVLALKKADKNHFLNLEEA